MRALLPLFLLTACGGNRDGAGDPTDSDVGPRTSEEWLGVLEMRGPRTVGHAETTVTYADPDPGRNGDRTVKVGLWYPAAATTGGTVSFPGPHGAEGVLDSAPPLDGPFPLAVFSHGHQGNLDNASHLMAWLASHGWVVAAPEHTGNTARDGDNRTTAIYLQRPRDISAVLDALLEGAPWSARLDGRVLALGHSFGGYTMFPLAGAGWAVDHWEATCAGDSDDPFCSTWSPGLAEAFRAGAADDRIAAFVTLSGGNWGQLREEGLATVDRPLLQLSGALDSAVSNEGSSDPIWRDLPDGGRVRVDLAHGDHQTYMDFADLGGFIPGTSADALDAARGFRIVYAYVGAFATREVLGEEGLDGILDGSLVVDDDATVSVK